MWRAKAMESIVVKGTIKRNSKRCYLVFFDAGGLRNIVPVMGHVESPGGQTVTIIGQMEGRRLRVHKIVPFHYPRRPVKSPAGRDQIRKRTAPF